jgi:hypothetical protein
MWQCNCLHRLRTGCDSVLLRLVWLEAVQNLRPHLLLALADAVAMPALKPRQRPAISISEHEIRHDNHEKPERLVRLLGRPHPGSKGATPLRRTVEEPDNLKPAQDLVMRLVGEILETIVTSAISNASRLAIALGNNAASFFDDFAPLLASFFYKSCSTRCFVIKDDFIAAADTPAEADADLVQVNLKHAADSAMESVTKRFSRLACSGWPENQAKRLEDVPVGDGVIVVGCRAVRAPCERGQVLQPAMNTRLFLLLCPFRLHSPAGRGEGEARCRPTPQASSFPSDQRTAALYPSVTRHPVSRPACPEE